MSSETNGSINAYMDEATISNQVRDGAHREVIGGLWEQLGILQRDFLISQGLRPQHKLLDIGCGSLRAGVPLTHYLDPHNYYGIDISASLLQAGYEQEILPQGLGNKLSQASLHVTQVFEAPFGVQFDFGLAQSVFSHLSLDYFAQCLAALAGQFASGGSIFATFFEGTGPQIARPDGIITYADRDPFHFPRAQILSTPAPGWRLSWIGNWDHPRHQQMVMATRL